MNSSLAHVLRTLQDLIRCAQPRRYAAIAAGADATSASNGARAAITAGAVAKCSTTGAGAAVTAKAGATYFTSNACTANNTVSSRVPGPTVDRRVSVNSGAERGGATKLCLHKCVMKRTRRKCVGRPIPLSTKPFPMTKTTAASIKPSSTNAKK